MAGCITSVTELHQLEADHESARMAVFRLTALSKLGRLHATPGEIETAEAKAADLAARVEAARLQFRDQLGIQGRELLADVESALQTLDGIASVRDVLAKVAADLRSTVTEGTADA